MKAADLREFTNEELLNKRKELCLELLNLRHQKVIRQIENPRRIREIKRTIAQVNTIVKERELGINQKSEERSQKTEVR
ncbi:MAG: 50S ribosomal protein L29 [bacterium]